MPEIIERGTLPADEADWQYDVINKCQFCSTTYRLVQGDTFRKISQRVPGAVRRLTSTCPLCGAQVVTISRTPFLPPVPVTTPVHLRTADVNARNGN